MLAAHYVAYGESSVLVVDRSTIAKPSCGDHDVLISVHATAINPVDCKLRAGSITAWPSSFPCVPGWDVSGIVAEVGSKCTRFAVGDAVYAYTRPAWDMEPSDDKPGFTKEEKIDANGTAAEFLAVKEWKVAAKPAALSFTQAACVPLVGLTAWQGLFVHAGLVAGQCVLILNASGGVGSMAVRLAKSRGCTVLASCSPRSAAFVAALGADHVLDYTKGSPLSSQARKAAGSSRVIDCVMDCIGGDSTAEGIAAVKEGGTVVSIANWGVGKLAAARKVPCVGKSFLVEPSAEQLAAIGALVDSGAIAPSAKIAAYPLADIAAAHAEQEGGRVQGKLVIHVHDFPEGGGVLASSAKGLLLCTATESVEVVGAKRAVGGGASSAAAAAAAVVLLVTSMPSTTNIEANQNSIKTMLNGNKIASWEEVDGMDAGSRARRDELFELSGKRGVYPQLFLDGGGGKLEFVGDFEQVQALNECGELPADTLAANPSIRTLQQVMARVAKK